MKIIYIFIHVNATTITPIIAPSSPTVITANKIGAA